MPFTLLAMGSFLACSAFFSCVETALFSLTVEDARRIRTVRRADDILALFRRDPSELLTAILLGNLLVNVLFFCTGSVAVGRWAESGGPWVEAVGGLLVLLAVIFFGEMIPKAVGITLAPDILRLASGTLRRWFQFTRPFRWFIRWLLQRLHLGTHEPLTGGDLTPGELKELLDSVQHEPGFGEQEKAVLEDILNLSDLRVREVMVPRVHVFGRPAHAARQAILQDARCGRHRYLLMYGDTDNDLLGYVRTGDLLADPEEHRPIESFIRPLLFVPETRRVDTLLREWIRNQATLAAVVDEYGGLSGIVTLEHLFAEVVGGFAAEESERIIKLDETTYRLSGSLSIRDWRELLIGILPGQEVESLAFDTLGGLVISLLGRIPRCGDTVMVRNLRLSVESMHHRRVETVLLHLNPPKEGA